MAMVCMAATAFHATNPDIATIENAYRTLIPLLGRGAAIVFLIALIASGLSSSAVGTLAGAGRGRAGSSSIFDAFPVAIRLPRHDGARLRSGVAGHRSDRGADPEPGSAEPRFAGAYGDLGRFLTRRRDDQWGPTPTASSHRVAWRELRPLLVAGARPPADRRERGPADPLPRRVKEALVSSLLAGERRWRTRRPTTT